MNGRSDQQRVEPCPRLVLLRDPGSGQSVAGTVCKAQRFLGAESCTHVPQLLNFQWAEGWRPPSLAAHPHAWPIPPTPRFPFEVREDLPGPGAVHPCA